MWGKVCRKNLTFSTEVWVKKIVVRFGKDGKDSKIKPPLTGTGVFTHSRPIQFKTSGGYLVRLESLAKTSI
jgi:hypothetical protein